MKAPETLRSAARQSIAADIVDSRTAADASEAERAFATRAALAQVHLLMLSEPELEPEPELTWRHCSGANSHSDIINSKIELMLTTGTGVGLTQTSAMGAVGAVCKSAENFI